MSYQQTPIEELDTDVLLAALSSTLGR